MNPRRAWLGIGLGLIAFLALAYLVFSGATQPFDRDGLLALRRPADLLPIGAPAMIPVAQAITRWGSTPVLILLAAIGVAMLAFSGRPRRAIFLAVVLTAGMIVATNLKDLFHRPRPALVPYETTFTGWSFPSGHAAGSAATFLTLAVLLAPAGMARRGFACAAALLTLLVGISRVYLGVHWPTDVIAGWLVGSLWALGVSLAARRFGAEDSTET